MTKEERQQKSAMAYGMFVMCHAAEMMLEYTLSKDGLIPASGLQHEAKMFYTMMIDGIKKALIGYRGFNERTAELYYDFGGNRGISTMDSIRRDANQAVCDYIYRRNAIDSKEDADMYDNMCNNAKFWHPGTVISQEVIDKFKMK